MILIFSEPGDISTEQVIDWLNFMKAPFIRINFVDVLNHRKSIYYDLQLNILRIGEIHISLEKIKAVWLRKIGHFKTSEFFSHAQASLSNNIIYDHLLVELNVFINTVLKNIPEDAFWITNINSLRYNKWEIARKAFNLGIRVPETTIVNNKEDLKRLSSSGQFITKPLKDPMTFLNGADSFSMYTKVIESKDIIAVNDTFFLSVVQKKIEKEFEIRSFYLEGEFYSMAIYSQSEASSAIDYREIGHLNLNRRIPYKLNAKLEANLDTLAKSLGINCGSFDLIHGIDGEDYFLEINPNGQYGMVDRPCNYGLDKRIAELLYTKSLL